MFQQSLGVPARVRKESRAPRLFPVELPRRCIEFYTFSGDVVLDPFMGVGTTAIVAKQTGRH